MTYDLPGTSIDPAALQCFVEEQIYTLPGAANHVDEFSILLTGSRATGSYSDSSDVDIDVLCPQAVYEAVHQASVAAGIIQSPHAFFHILNDPEWHRYFGRNLGRPHFTLTSLEAVERQIAAYEDVPLWIWTNARIIVDPVDQFQRAIDRFQGYPKDVLVRKIKRHWLASGYWAIDGYAHHHGRQDMEVLTSAAGLLNSILELLRFFFVVEGRPYPYMEKLMFFAPTTKLGAEFCPLLQQMADRVVGRCDVNTDAWERLDETFRTLWDSGQSEQARQLDKACAAEMLAAGLEPEWVAADYRNIDELLTGKLGPFST